jgi:hypothetical protein
MGTSPDLMEKNEAPASKRFSLISILLISLLVVVLGLIGLEGASRIPKVARRFPVRSVGSHTSQFETKWFKLQNYVKTNGGVDVILLGNSMVNTGVDPAVFADEYEKQTGIRLRVFNFGVEGTTVEPNLAIAEILVNTYRPKYLLYFTEMRDYVAGNGQAFTVDFLENDWLQFRLGKPALKGWVIDKSAAMQMLLPFRGWSRSDFLDTYLFNIKRINDTRENGYEPDRNTSQDWLTADPNSPEEKMLFDLYRNFQIDSTRMDQLKTLVELTSHGTTVIVTEIPAHTRFFDYFGGEGVHQSYLGNIASVITQTGGLYVPPLDPNLIPLEGRPDNHHLNYLGAETFSNLLAEQFARLCLDQQFCMETP